MMSFLRSAGISDHDGPEYADSIWEQSFSTLSPERDHNYLCLQSLFERGPRIIPGLEAEYAQRVVESKREVPPLQITFHEVERIAI